jgi:hypothetical protein
MCLVKFVVDAKRPAGKAHRWAYTWQKGDLKNGTNNNR